jgi:hypothetical protein
VTQQPASEQSSSSERAAEQPPALHATTGMRHMRRKLTKGKSVRRIQRQPASDAAATALSSTKAAQSDTDKGVPHSKSAAFGDDATDAASHSGRATESEAPTEVVLRVVTDSGLVMSRPARRASAAAAAALEQNLPKVQCCATILNASLPCIFAAYTLMSSRVPSLLKCMHEVIVAQYGYVYQYGYAYLHVQDASSKILALSTARIRRVHAHVPKHASIFWAYDIV